MIVLAIDTSGEACAAAVYDSASDRVLGEISETIGRGHAERLMAVIAEAMARAGTSHDDLDRISVATGPGSFTGIRVGVATARGFALGLSLPVTGASVLDALVACIREREDGRIAVLLEAGRGECYGLATFDTALARAGEAFIANEHALADIPQFKDPGLILGGDCAARLAGTGQLCGRVVNDSPIAPIAMLARLGAAADPEAAPARPLYLRKPDAKPQEGFAVSRAG